jgi:hypothetical protein
MADIVVLRQGAPPPALPAEITIPLSDLNRLPVTLFNLRVTLDTIDKLLAMRTASNTELVINGVRELFSAFSALANPI